MYWTLVKYDLLFQTERECEFVFSGGFLFKKKEKGSCLVHFYKTIIVTMNFKHPNLGAILPMCTLLVRGDFNVEIQQLLFGHVRGRFGSRV